MKAAPWHGSTLQEQCGQAAVGAQIGEVYLWKHLLKGKYLMVCIFWQRRRGWHGSSYHTCSVWSRWLQRTCAFHGRLASIWRENPGGGGEERGRGRVCILTEQQGVGRRLRVCGLHRDWAAGCWGFGWLTSLSEEKRKVTFIGHLRQDKCLQSHLTKHSRDPLRWQDSSVGKSTCPQGLRTRVWPWRNPQWKESTNSWSFPQISTHSTECGNTYIHICI